MSSPIPRAAGFFAVTIVLMTTDHLMKLAMPSEVVDAAVTKLLSTFVFTLGGRIAGGSNLLQRSPRHELVTGALAGAVTVDRNGPTLP